MRLPGFRLRTLMMVVALVAATTSGLLPYLRSNVFQTLAFKDRTFEEGALSRARIHDDWAVDAWVATFRNLSEFIRYSAGKRPRIVGHWRPGSKLQAPTATEFAISHFREAGNRASQALREHGAASVERRKAAHHRIMRLKYERAARYSWLPVAPDPPEPK
jgi:hypothetical protein